MVVLAEVLELGRPDTLVEQEILLPQPHHKVTMVVEVLQLALQQIMLVEVVVELLLSAQQQHKEQLLEGLEVMVLQAL
jgi:hypothetical protein